MRKNYIVVALLVVTFFALSILLVSLGSSKPIYVTDKVKLETSLVHSSAQLYHFKNDKSYEGFCDSSYIKELTKLSLENLSRVISCLDSKDTFALKVWIGEPYNIYKCVDQTTTSFKECEHEKNE